MIIIMIMLALIILIITIVLHMKMSVIKKSEWSCPADDVESYLLPFTRGVLEGFVIARRHRQEMLASR